MGKKSGPDAPDPVATAEAQADANRLNIFSPYGQIQFGNVDSSGNFVPNYGSDSREAVSFTETDNQQFIRGAQDQLARKLAGQVLGSNPVLPDARQNDLTVAGIQSNLPSLPNSLPDVRGSSQIESNLLARPDINSITQNRAGDINAVEQATYQRGLNLLQPDFNENRSRIEESLSNKGIPIGSDAYAKELDRLERSQGNQLENLALSSVQAGRNEAQRLFGNELNIFDRGTQQRSNSLAEQLALSGQESGLRNQLFSEGQTARQNSLAEQLALRAQKDTARQQALNEQLALLGQNQLNPTAPSIPFAGVDVAGPIQANYAAQSQQAAANNQALGGLLGSAGGMAAALAFSDLRLKENVSIVDTMPDGINIYEFNYIGDDTTYRGVIAQDIANTYPEAIVVDDSGYMKVDYSKLGIQMEVV